MARYLESVCKLCRNEGEKLFLKGSRCYTTKCAIDRRRYGTGQHGQDRKKQSEYAVQLREKQKLRRTYGVFERQFAGYFEEANRQKRVPTGLRLLQLLEIRLDNIAYRSGMVPSRIQARQLVRHGHFTVDGKRCSIASYQLKPGQVVSISEHSKKFIKELIELNPATGAPKWINADIENLRASIINLPAREDLDQNVKEALIVEYYSR
ncbi:MAG: 30S ribosomal protein S4 [Candidatus Melainabacteria bacterium]|nr:30S ribosomal protein S4 [Candidatus Melainabacteria bacterium]